MNRYDVGRRVETYRDKLKMSTQELARRIKRSQATISRIENGKQGVSLELLAQIAKELHVHPFALLSDEPLRHSVLLPVSANRMQEHSTNLLAHALILGRLKREMAPEEAAKILGVTRDEVESIEFGFSLPDSQLLAAMAKLYGLEEKELTAVAKLCKDAPDFSKRLSFLYQVFAEIHHAARVSIQDKADTTLGRIRELLSSADSSAALLPGNAAEEAEAFQHYMSSHLESALKDDKFRDQIMQLVKKHETDKYRLKTKEPNSSQTQ